MDRVWAAGGVRPPTSGGGVEKTICSLFQPSIEQVDAYVGIRYARDFKISYLLGFWRRFQSAADLK